MNKKLPPMKTDSDMEALLEQDLTDYIHKDNFKPIQFEFLPKTEQINLRLSKQLLQAVKQQAEQAGLSYQKYIRLTLEQALTE